MARIVVLVTAIALLAPACGTECASCAASRGLLIDTCYLQAHEASGCRSDASTFPNGRYLAALGFDATAKDFVLFGGQTAKGTSDETWLFTPPSTWRLAKPAHRPPPRRGAAMAWDPVSGTVLLYGGLVPDRAEGFPSDQTWSWDGTDWRQLQTSGVGPGARDGASMVTAGERVLLFGGHEFNTRYYGDAWTWDGARWNRVDHGARPEGRGNAGVMWEPQTSSLLVFGGYGLRAGAGPGNLGTPLADAWSLRDGAWSATSAPPETIVMPFAYENPTSQRPTVAGVACPASGATKWELNTGNWVQLVKGPNFGRWGVAVATEPSGATLMFGGSTEEVAC
jgi:hypothetical protein